MFCARVIRGLPKVLVFESVTVVLPVLNETVSLRETVEIILRDAKADVRELLIVVCEKTTPETMAVVEALKQSLPELVVVLPQRLPFLGGALRDGFEIARGSHVVMMSTDLETDPAVVKDLIAAARKRPEAIVTTSRWRQGGEFNGYSPVKLVCNWFFQKFFSLLFWTHLTDMTFGYRLLPTQVAQAIRWEELRHPFNLESVLKPLRLGVPVLELPCVWHPRIEGESSNPFWRNFVYVRIGLKTRFASRQGMLK